MSLRATDPNLLRPEVSNRTVQPFLTWLRTFRSEAYVEEVIARAGLAPGDLEDPDGWISHQATALLAEEAVRRLGLPGDKNDKNWPGWRYWQEMGRDFFRPEQMGALYGTVKAFGSARLLYRAVPAQSAALNRCMAIRLTSQGPGLVVFEHQSLDPRRWPDSPWACWNRIGIFEAIPTIWGKPLARVEHLRCAHDPNDPAPHCVYHVHFQEPWLHEWMGLGLRSFIVMALGWGLARGFGLSELGLPIGLLLTQLAAEGWWQVRKLRTTVREEAAHSTELIRRFDQRYTAMWEKQRDLHLALMANNKFSAYLPADLVKQLRDDPMTSANLEGQETEAAVLFADIVGFTPRCERHPARQIVADLNLWFQEVDPVIERNGGIIDKRIGDAIMVVFVPREESTGTPGLRAIRCAFDMLKALEGCNQKLEQAGGEVFRIRIGIAAGPLVQGTMGSKVRYEYTVVGDVVNLASRLESRARSGHVLTTAALYDRLQDPPGQLVERRSMDVKGKLEPVEVVELRSTYTLTSAP